MNEIQMSNGKCADQAGWKEEAQSGQYLCCSHATTSFSLMTKILCVAGPRLLAVWCLWMINLNKTIISVLVHTESTRRYS